jgi:hypothetical protein
MAGAVNWAMPVPKMQIVETRKEKDFFMINLICIQQRSSLTQQKKRTLFGRFSKAFLGLKFAIWGGGGCRV